MPTSRYVFATIIFATFASLTPADTLADGQCTGNGPCGPRGLEWAVPQGFAGADFRPACARHDHCYTIPGTSRRVCDNQFHRDLLYACNNSRHPILCRMTAHTMGVVTKLFGGPAFRGSQRGWYR
jgi:hypothetical protein